MQVVRYMWETNRLSGEPFLVAGDTKMRLMNEEIKLTLGRRSCIGYTKKGRRVACPKSRDVKDERVCHECAINDDFFFCIKCDGSQCINEPQRAACSKSKYYIYLAAFNTALKVGISQEHRVLVRLIEQGADMGAKIGLVKDGLIVRQIEQKIKNELGIADRMSGEDKHRMLFGNLNAASINIFNAVAKLRLNGLSEHLIGPEIYNLQGIYRLSSVQSLPKFIPLKENVVLAGKVIAAKGNIVVVKNDSGFFSFDANKMIGYDITSSLYAND